MAEFIPFSQRFFNKFRYSLLLGPAKEPITLAEAKSWLGIDATVTEFDSEITLLITAARVDVEKFLCLALITQTWRLSLDVLPSDCNFFNLSSVQIILSKPPLQSVTSVTVFDSAETPTVIDSTNYLVRTYEGDCPEYGRVVFKRDFTFPNISELREADAFEIDFIAGYGDDEDDVPEGIRNAILMEIAFRFLNKGDCVDETMGVTCLAALTCVQQYRKMKL